MLIRFHKDGTEEERQRFEELAWAATTDPKRQSNPWPLPNMRECTAHDFWHLQTCWGLKANAYCGSHKIGDSWAVVLVFLADVAELMNGGFVVAKFYSGPRGQAQDIGYWKWGACAHEFDSRTTANCETTHTCKKCGAAFAIDSSD